MIAASVRIVYNNMPRFDSAARVHVKTGSQLVAEKVLEDMRRLVPVRTGALRDGLYINQVSGMAAYHVGIGSRQDYWPYVEYGTSRRDPRPFIAPAVQMNMAEFKAIIAAEIVNATLSIAGPAVVG